MQNKLALAGAAVLLMAATAAGTAAYINNRAPQEEVVAQEPKPAKPRARAAVEREGLPWREERQAYRPAPQPQPVAARQPACDDKNVLGYALGGVAGGVLGNQIGDGSGRTAATVAGALGGAYLGGQHIPLKNTLCR